MYILQDGDRGSRASTFGLLQRFQAFSNFDLDEHCVNQEKIGLYACLNIQTKSDFDFAIWENYVQVNSTTHTREKTIWTKKNK